MPLTKSKGGIVYTKDDQRTRILIFSLEAKNAPVQLSPAQYRTYTSVPSDISYSLKNISSAITGPGSDDTSKANRLKNYFLDHFQYSLDVNFRADNQGLIKMIIEQRPAYCTYFATALTLLLRSQDIPARVATGFLADEKIDKKKNKFLARVYDAHAWVEVLLEDTDPETGLLRKRWQILDPTPAAERTQAIKYSIINFSKIAENLWLGMLRFSAYMENLDKDKLKKNIIITLTLLMLLINVKKIFKKFLELIVSVKKRTPKTKEKKDPVRSIYQRYEHYLKTAFGETRGLTETDHEVIDRLKTKEQIPAETIGKMESFVRQYHAARFGLRRDNDLGKIIEDMKREA